MKPAKRKTSVHSSDGEDNSDDYKKKRERNNLAVKKCREKLNEKAKETKERVEKLKRENLILEGTIEELRKNVKVLKDLLLGSGPSKEQQLKIQEILEDFE